jgi:DNA-binding SARP family transcriptional activator
MAVIFVRPTEKPVSPPTSEVMFQAYTLGPFKVYAGEHLLPHQGWRRKKALTLLKYLLTQRGHPVHREVLLELLWPEVPVETGLGRLKVVAYFLRRQLHCEGATSESTLLLKEGDSYLLNPERLWLDADAFDKLVDEGAKLSRQGQVRDALRRYQQAEALYRGDYMEDELYSDWCALDRARLRERFLTILGDMALLYERASEPKESVAMLRKAISVEPCRESLHRGLMKLLWALGSREEALSQYQVCKQFLSKELGVGPMPETDALYQRILGSENCS